MADTNNTARSGGIGFGGLLTIVFITLKLCGVIAWPWLWVLAPLWIPLALVAGIFAVILACAGVVALVTLIANGVRK